MKKIFYLIILLLVNHSVHSQDLIYKVATTDSILSTIIEVNVDNIKYKKYSNLSGPLYTINKTDIDRIVYKNGDIEYYNNEKVKSYATVYVIRPRKKGSFWNGMTIYENERMIGVLSAKNYLKWEVEVKNTEVIITSKCEGRDELRINPKAGKTYYIKQSHKMGAWKARPVIEFIDKKEADKLLKKTTRAESKVAQ